VPLRLDGPTPAEPEPDSEPLELERSVLAFVKSFVLAVSVSHLVFREAHTSVTGVQIGTYSERHFLQRKQIPRPVMLLYLQSTRER